MSCGADTEANALLASLLAGEDVSLPEINYGDDDFQIPSEVLTGLKGALKKLNNSDLTTETLDGTGVFDSMMRAVKAHLHTEFEKGRITGQEYTKVYIAGIQTAMGQSIQFLLQRDLVFWQAQQAQLQALTARLTFETAKMQLGMAKYEALNAKSTYALTKLRLSTEDIAYCTAKYQLETMLPKQAVMLDKQVEGQSIQNQQGDYTLKSLMPQQLATGQYQLDKMLPAQWDMITKQVIGQEKQNLTLDYQLEKMLPAQLLMVSEQTEAQRAQTLNVRTDGEVVTGLMGKQKDLYSQQITSYQRDAEVKAAKLFTDAWITMKTIDEGLEPPTQFANDSLNGILGVLKTNNQIG